MTIDEAVRALRTVPPGWSTTAWETRTVGPFDAFGQSGRYNPWRLARAYGGLNPQVVRGSLIDSGAPAAAWSAVSPYPDPGFTRLEQGTLLIVLDLTTGR